MCATETSWQDDEIFSALLKTLMHEFTLKAKMWKRLQSMPRSMEQIPRTPDPEAPQTAANSAINDTSSPAPFSERRDSWRSNLFGAQKGLPIVMG
jgi:hypothetical protein